MALSVPALTAEAQQDTIVSRNLDEFVVRAAQVAEGSPMAKSNVTGKELQTNNFGQDVPYLISQTPSVIVTSDAGTGIGYTSFRIRGTGDSRINVTVNGVPLNDSESQTTFWVNMPDFASSTGEVQVQRGVGSSTNGAGAFGASISMMTERASMTPFFEASETAGSFGTSKTTVKGSTGLMNNLFVADARYSKMRSNGYIDRAKADVSSYYGSLTMYRDATQLKFTTFGSAETTNQAWNYVPSDYIKAGNRTYNSCGEYEENGVTKYYDQTDNYWQQHYHLSMVHSFNAYLGTSLTLHYTHGKGYYEDYKAGAKLAKFGLEPFNGTDGQTVKRTDLVRRKWMRNDFYGFVFKADYKKDFIDAIFGLGANNYEGDHFGRVIWARNYFNLSPTHEYYRNKGEKLDYNAYLKTTFATSSHTSIYADLQYRGIHYTIDGTSDKVPQLDVDTDFGFFNPKFGFNYRNGGQQAYASFAIGHREPGRNNYTDESAVEHPTYETLYDYEVGYSVAGKRWNTAVSLYYMDYDNQLIQTGRLSEIGEALTTNIKDSYRMGVELSGNVQIADWLRWQANITLSQNKIRNFVESVAAYDANWDDIAPIEVKYDKTDIAFSPSVTANNTFSVHAGGFDAGLNSVYVSRQYLDNTACRSRSIDSYFVSNATLSYTFNTKAVDDIVVGLRINNLFNEKYETSGWVSSCVVEGESTVDNRTVYDGLAVQATTNFMINIKLRIGK